MRVQILAIVGPTASGKSARAIALAKEKGGEIISVDSRQVYRGLDIGTEKVTTEEMQGIPHHLIDIRSPKEPYSAGEFVRDAHRLIEDIAARGKLPILVGGSHFYFDALFNGLPGDTDPNPAFRATIEDLPTNEIYARVKKADPWRASELDPNNRRRLIRALELIDLHGRVPERKPVETPYEIEWLIIDPPSVELRKRIDARLMGAFSRGLTEEVRRVREEVGDARLDELGLEYKIVGEYLRGERTEESLIPALSAKLWHYARRQKAWLRKLAAETIEVAEPLPGRN